MESLKDQARVTERDRLGADVGRSHWAEGTFLMVLDRFKTKSGRQSSKWRLAEVVEVDPVHDRVLVHFDGWARKWDVWINIAAEPERFRPLADINPGTMPASFDMRMRNRGLQQRTVAGDGNCLFRAVALLVLGDESLHTDLRARACDFLEANKERMRWHTEEDFDDYIARMRRSGEWASELEIRALESELDVRCVIYAAHIDSDKPLNIHFRGDEDEEAVEEAGKRTVNLAYLGRAHYNALVPVDESQQQL